MFVDVCLSKVKNSVMFDFMIFDVFLSKFKNYEVLIRGSCSPRPPVISQIVFRFFVSRRTFSDFLYLFPHYCIRFYYFFNVYLFLFFFLSCICFSRFFIFFFNNKIKKREGVRGGGSPPRLSLRIFLIFLDFS